MSKARDLARVIVDSGGLIAAGNLGNAVPADGSITDAKIASMAASKLTGVLPDANAPSGSVVQVVTSQMSTNRVQTSSTSHVDTGLSATITPTSASNKILVIVQHTGLARANGGNGYINMILLRNSTQIAQLETQAGYVAFNTSGEISFGGTGSNVLDSPATTSPVTYKTQFRNAGDIGVNVFIERQAGIILMEITP